MFGNILSGNFLKGLKKINNDYMNTTNQNAESILGFFSTAFSQQFLESTLKV